MKKRKQTYKLPKILEENLPSILVTVSILLSHFIFPQNELKIFISFIVLIPIFAYFKFDNRIPVGYAILLLVLAAIVLAFHKNENLANQLAVYAYWLLVVGIIGMIIECIKEKTYNR